MTSNSYNEDATVDLVSSIYHTLLRLGHFEAEEIIWPPAGGHQLDFGILEGDAALDERVSSLIRKLPIQAAESRKQVCQTMQGVDYREADILLRSRDIVCRSSWAPENHKLESNCDPMDLLLFDYIEWDDACLILSTKDIDEFTRSTRDQVVLGAYRSNYRNWPQQSAPSYLQGILSDLLSGKVVTDLNGGLINVEDRHANDNTKELRRVLIEDCGWPSDDFRIDEWKLKCPGLVEASQQEWLRQMGYP